MGKTHVLDAIGDMIGDAALVLRARPDELSGRVPMSTVQGLLGLPFVQPPPSSTMDDAVAALDRLCAAGPTLLLIDDAHLVDEESLRFLHRAVEATAALPLVVVLARRPFPSRRRLTVIESLPSTVSVELAPLAADEVAALVESVLGHGPDRRLQQVLAATGGNPFHARTLLMHLQRRGALVRVSSPAGRVLIDTATDAHVEVATSMSTALRAHVESLDRSARAVADTVAVWGEAVSIADLASARRASAVSVAEDAQLAVESGILRWTDSAGLTFHHDLYRDVVYSLLADPVRSVLHAACADALTESGAPATKIARHAALSTRYGRPYPRVLSMVESAASELAGSPATAAQWWKDAGELVPPEGSLTDTLTRPAAAARRAAALAKAGSLTEAGDVAAEGLRAAVDPQLRGTLRSIQISALIATARVADASSAIDHALTAPMPSDRRTWLLSLRRWLVLLGGREPLSSVDDGFVVDGRSLTDLVEIGVRACLTGRCSTGIDILDRVLRIDPSAGEVGGDGATGPVWPVWARLISRGPLAAGEALDAQPPPPGAWLDPYREFVRSGIAYRAGRWPDAAAGWDSALEAAAHHDSGWVSLAVGPRATLDVERGNLDHAARRLDAWDADPTPHQFGLPEVVAARASLAAAGGDTLRAAELLSEAWSAATDSGRAVWAVLGAVDAARTALLADDRPFLDRIARDLSAVSAIECPAVEPVASVVDAIRGDEPESAMTAAIAFDRAGDHVYAVAALEEAACAAARTGDHRGARRTGTDALARAREMGAVTQVRRVTARLRRDGVHLGAVGSRSRPSVGWASLTPTETIIADLVASGLSGPDIAARLHISPRTVQTHVSRVLGKLGLRTRVELAAAAHRRPDGPRTP